MFDFAGFFLAERFVFQQGGKLALVDGGSFGEARLLSAVFVCNPLPQVEAAQVGNGHFGSCG